MTARCGPCPATAFRRKQPASGTGDAARVRKDRDRPRHPVGE
ncbi:hypothetical protein HMPREF9057_01320 [Actinomyces sp. oral taxon 171 str. F0337]|nr:hypothetical protein HMPREF9057_01320 [Actinomyces sp. oral taxon 171 str. F0337]